MKTKITFLISVVLLGVGYSAAFAADPVITSISPTSAKVGDTVTITGTNFPANALIHLWRQEASYYKLDAKPTTITPTRATFVVPFGYSHQNAMLPKISIGPDPAYDGAYKYPVSNEVDFSILDSTPIITSVTPASPKVGEMVTVTGTGFNFGARLYAYYQVPGVPTKSEMILWSADSPTSVTFKMPTGIKGPTTWKFGVSTVNGWPTKESNEVNVTVLPMSPTLECVTSDGYCTGNPYVGLGSVAKQIPINTGFPEITELFLRGENIDSDSDVVIDGSIYASKGYCKKNYVNTNCIYIPQTVSPGMHTLQIKQRDTGLTSNTISINVLDKPFLSYVYAPTSNAVQLCGIGLDSKAVAFFDNTTEGGPLPYLGEPTVCSNYKIPGTVGAGSHSVQIKQATGKLSNAINFTVVAAASSAASVQTPPATPPASASVPTTAPTTQASAPATQTPVPTQTPTQQTTNAALQQQLVQLITTLLQLVQQAAAKGLLTSSQVLSILSSVQIPR